MLTVRVFIFLICITCNFIYAQNYISYYNLANEAEKNFNTKNYESAKQKFIFLQNKFTTLKPRDYFYLANIYYITNDSVNGFKYLTKCAVEFGFPSEKIKKYKNINPLFSPSSSQIKQLDSLEKICLGKRKKTIIDTLIYFDEIDQLCRSHPEIDTVCDYNNQSQFLKYLRKNGFPNCNLYGDIYTEVFFHIYNNELYAKYECFVLKELKKGNIDPFFYALLIDKKRYDMGQPTMYGCYGLEKCDSETCKSNRTKIGLSIYYTAPNYRF